MSGMQGMSGADPQADYLEEGSPENAGTPPEVLEPQVPDPWHHTERRRWRSFRDLSDRTPLRTKLITAVLALVILALAVISIASIVVWRTYLITQQDTSLTAALNNITASGKVPAGASYGEATQVQADLVIGIQAPGQQLTWAPSNNPFAQYTQQEPLPQLPTSSNWAPSDNPVPRTFPAQAGDGSWRVLAQTASVTAPSGAQETGTLVIAASLGNIDGFTHRLVVFDLLAGGGIVVVLAAVAVGVIRANLRPLDDIEMTAGQIARGHLNHRIPERDPRTEIGSLGHSLNAMLSQIETAFHAQEQSEQAAHQSEERMRRFIADASHELRTPVTTIRGFAEYYRQRGGISRTDHAVSPADDSSSAKELTPQDLDRLMHRVESEASRMGLLVEDLLQLARLDQQRPLDKAPVDLLTLAADAVQDARVVAPGRPVDLIVAPGAAFIIDGDEARLRQVIGNLVNNALTHTPAGTPVRVRIGAGTLDSGGPAVVLDVEDDGPGMSAEQAQRVFERFYRADQARNRASGGTGLGLAIVHGLVTAHGGTVSVHTAPGQGADFQVKLPLSPDAQGEDAEDD